MSVNFNTFSNNSNNFNKYYINYNGKSIQPNRKQIGFCGQNTKLSNITPSMIALNINSEHEDMQNFRDVISDYSYGKKSLINNPDSFKIYAKNGDIYLDGFHNPDENIKEGICEELTYKVGKELEKKYGDKYIFIATKGNYIKNNMQHYYITAVKRTKENEENIQNILKKTKQLTNMAEIFMKNIETNNFDINELQKLQDEAEKINSIKKESLANAILIDPSFHTVKKYSEEGDVDGYTQDSFFDFQTMNPYQNSSYKFSKNATIFGIQIPIGFAKDIAPDLNIESDKLLSLSIISDEYDNVEAEICTQDKSGQMEQVKLDENHNLYKFINNAIINRH